MFGVEPFDTPTRAFGPERSHYPQERYGSLDSGFAPVTSGLNNLVFAISRQSDGKVVVGGSFTSYDGTAQPRVTRLNADGTLDTSFVSSGTGLSSNVNALSLQGDGKLVAGGIFTTYNGTSAPRVARLNSDGSLDTGFAPTGTGLSGGVSAISVQTNGKVVVGGAFTTYNGVPRPYLARLNSDGSLDTGFAQTGTGLDNQVTALAQQGDGKILVGGWFSTYNGTAAPRVARLNSDGSLDSGFAPTGSGINNLVNAVALQGDGKLLVGGFFTSYNGTSAPYVARLNSDGSLDPTFAPTGSGLNGTANAISVQSDGKIVVGGTFTGYGVSTANYIVRLTYIGTLD